MKQGPKGSTDHGIPDAYDIKKRLQEYGDNIGNYYAEGRAWGVETPTHGGIEKHAFMIMMKILGEAVYQKNRTNGDFARNIWSQKLSKAAVFNCMNMKEGRMAVFNYADSFVQNPKA